ncbi:MAG: hypothetical protein KDI63_15030 [Gammaproteobacteria bacterium]|nr:hypothetical protein [Gammaproteobacteria bacterium]
MSGIGLVLSRTPDPPKHQDNICAIFEARRGWFREAVAVEARWGTPAHVQLAIIKQESGFRNDAQPPRRTLLGFIPWSRPSTAYGYPQAMDDTWDWYMEQTGNRGAHRDDFGDATDFIGWYTDMSHRRLKIAKSDTYRQYLAYHEGHGGFSRGSYEKKPWLKIVAAQVDTLSKRYAAQLRQCRETLQNAWQWWPFS